MSRRVGHLELESGRRRSAARTAPKNGGTKVQYQKMWLPIATVVVQYCTTTAKPFLAMARMRGDVGRAAAAAAAAELGLPADLQAAPAALRQVAQLPAAVQTMYCHARDTDEFHEQAGAVIEAYNKALEAGALESTAERAAAAVAYKIDPGYREYLEHDKQWKLERCEAAAILEKLAMQARRVVKKARRLDLPH